jgi:hypothetical protein
MDRSRAGLRAAFAALACTLVAGCGPATKSDPEFWTPYAGIGGASPDVDDPPATTSTGSGAGAGAGGGGGAPASPQQGLLLEFTTISLDGEYAPKNVGAVWVADGQDAFVKTLEVWASKRANHLVKWKLASGANVVDAVTSATKKSHGPHASQWDGTNVAGEPVQDGDYRVYVEFTEWNSASQGNPPGPWIAVDFTKGSTPVELTPPDQEAFTSIQLIYQP